MKYIKLSDLELAVVDAQTEVDSSDFGGFIPQIG
jgi:hypothetical protein